jgi:hypothetical protein
MNYFFPEKWSRPSEISVAEGEPLLFVLLSQLEVDLRVFLEERHITKKLRQRHSLPEFIF